MDIYQYVAESDPYTAKAICNKFGYDTSAAQSVDDLSSYLKQLVAAEGQPALNAIVEVHPDKELILEVAGKTTSEKTPCGCKEKKSVAKVVDTYVERASNATSGFSMHQGNTFLIAAALILAVAVITSSNNSKS